MFCCFCCVAVVLLSIDCPVFFPLEVSFLVDTLLRNEEVRPPLPLPLPLPLDLLDAADGEAALRCCWREGCAEL